MMRVELASHRGERRAGRDSRQDAQALVVAAVEPDRFGAVAAERQVQVDLLREEAEARRQDAHDDLGKPVEPDGAPDDRGIGAKAASPELVEIRTGRVGSGPIVGVREGAPDGGPDARAAGRRTRSRRPPAGASGSPAPANAT